MQINNLAILFSVAAIRAAAETTIDNDDVPLACANICRDTINLSNRCEIQADNDNSNTDDDIIYNNCFCQETNAKARIEECATCVKANGMSNANNDNEVAELMRDCGWDFAAANTTPANAGPTPTGTGTTTGLGGVVPSVTLAPTTVTTGGTTVVVSTPTVVSNTQLSTTNQPGAGTMATPAVALVAAGLAAALL